MDSEHEEVLKFEYRQALHAADIKEYLDLSPCDRCDNQDESGMCDNVADDFMEGCFKVANRFIEVEGKPIRFEDGQIWEMRDGSVISIYHRAYPKNKDCYDYYSKFHWHSDDFAMDDFDDNGFSVHDECPGLYSLAHEFFQLVGVEGCMFKTDMEQDIRDDMQSIRDQFVFDIPESEGLYIRLSAHEYSVCNVVRIGHILHCVFLSTSNGPKLRVYKVKDLARSKWAGPISINT